MREVVKKEVLKLLHAGLRRLVLTCLHQFGRKILMKILENILEEVEEMPLEEES